MYPYFCGIKKCYMDVLNLIRNKPPPPFLQKVIEPHPNFQKSYPLWVMEAHIMLQQQLCLKNVCTIIFSLIYINSSSNKNVLKIQFRHILNNVNPNVKAAANHAGPPILWYNLEEPWIHAWWPEWPGREELRWSKSNCHNKKVQGVWTLNTVSLRSSSIFVKITE